MSKQKPEYYKNAYNKLYGFLQNKHPEILEEYRKLVQAAKTQAEQIVILSKEEKT